jgi:hypothetical protein
MVFEMIDLSIGSDWRCSKKLVQVNPLWCFVGTSTKSPTQLAIHKTDEHRPLTTSTFHHRPPHPPRSTRSTKPSEVFKHLGFPSH